MKRNGMLFLYIILGLGLLISFVSLNTGIGGSGLGSFIKNITITSIVVFTCSILFLLLTFSSNKNSIFLWMLILISLPLTTITLYHQIGNIYIQSIQTTTPLRFAYNNHIKQEDYRLDVNTVVTLVDSLLRKKIIFTKSELAERYFNGQFYHDTIERKWAIDLPQGLNYQEIFIDTIFHSPTNDSLLSGLMIAKVFNDLVDYPNGGVEYNGYGFIFNRRGNNEIQILNNSTSSDSYNSCSENLRRFYLKRIRLPEGEYNMNDQRFWSEKSNNLIIIYAFNID